MLVKPIDHIYDALQYPLIFWQGEDGYNFRIMQINNPGRPKKVNYHAIFSQTTF